MLKSPEWRKLSSSAKVVWVYMRAKFNTKTFSEITLTYSEMADLMAPATLKRSFKELIDCGFIVKTKQGGLMGESNHYQFNGQFKHFHYKGFKV